ncbi:hypothetical protein [Microbulbifer sp. THAF38]|uniref:hypothetical protein n=1 Tax=Microbulbifer sp. THAF38 TaxID=2587856 RepID=UPI001268C03B|nr:hypothetical protein [Microbulbifer sp. THAF38]QFT53760.1 hypothetical protein FIU95_04120 [Microbulbifer sp. THAF38]
MNRILLRRVAPMTMALLLPLGTPIALAVNESADTEVTLRFTPTISINGFEDLVITDPDSGENAVDWESFCIRGIGFSTFEILFESENGTNEYILTDGTINIPYQVGFENVTNGGFTPTTEGTALAGQAIQDPGNCNGNGVPENSTFEVTILNADWENARVLSGTEYTDTLTITVTSE